MIEGASHFPWPLDLLPRQPVLRRTGEPEVITKEGPREESLVELAKMLAAHRGTPVTVQGVRDPADPDAEVQAAGGLLPGPGARLAGPTFAEWLDQK
jgi:hypothetical protein